jgi:GT2 family glycosyltransferase
MPLVSVVTPAYQAELFLETAMRSVHAQSHRPLEHIVVDDGSHDATARIAEALAHELQDEAYTVRVIRLGANGGAARALDLGLDQSRGDLVCWLSADDAYFEKDKTSEQVGILARAPAAAGAFDWLTATGPDPDTARIVRARWPRFMQALGPLRRMDPAFGLIGLMFFNPINGTSVMLRRNWLLTSGRFDSQLGNYDADADLWMRIQALGGRLIGRNGCGTFYRLHPGQTSNDVPGMVRGMSLSRLRMLQELSTQDLLVPALKEAQDVLALAYLSRLQRVQPYVAAGMAQLAMEAGSRGLAATILRRMQHEVHSAGLLDQATFATWMQEASALRQSDSHVRFASALSALP